MSYCSATRKYNVPNSDGSDNWRTAECGKLKNDAQTAHRDETLEHEDSNRGKRWNAPLDSHTKED